MSRPLSPRTTVLVLVVSQVVLLLALVGVLAYTAQASQDAELAGRRASEINRAAIARDCRDKEEIKAVIRTLLQAVIAFNSRSELPEFRERVPTYRTLLTQVEPLQCQLKGAGQ